MHLIIYLCYDCYILIELLPYVVQFYVLKMKWTDVVPYTLHLLE